MGRRRIVGGEHLPKFALAAARDLEEFPGQLDGFLLRRDFQDREAGDKLLRLGEWSIRHDGLPVGATNSRPLCARKATLGRDQPATFHALLDELLQCNQWDRAGEWLTKAYHQHNPNAASGLDGVVTFFTKVMKRQRVDKCDKLTTEVVAVIADDEYVTVMMPRKYPDPRKAGTEYYTTWFDTWRFVDGKADEHWDPATIAAPATK